jgi:hypothetical protein
VHICPDWAFRVVQNLGSDRTQQETPKGAVPVRGHHDEIYTSFARILRDDVGWLSSIDNPLDVPNMLVSAFLPEDIFG